MKKLLVNVIAAITMVLSMFIVMGSSAQAATVPANMHWDGTVAKWDPVDGSDEYWVYLLYGDGRTVGNNGYSATKNYYDFAEQINKEGSGTYKFQVSYRIGDDWIESDDISPAEDFVLSLSIKNNPSISTGPSGFVIPEIRITDCFKGGTEPYSYKLISGPDWIKLNDYNCIVGTRTTPGENADVVVRVTDKNAEKIDITIPVGATTEAVTYEWTRPEWNGDTMVWAAVENATAYWIRLYDSNGTQVEAWETGTNNCDASTKFSLIEDENYTFTVCPKMYGAYQDSLTSPGSKGRFDCYHKGTVQKERIVTITPAKVEKGGATKIAGTRKIEIYCDSCKEIIRTETETISSVNSWYFNGKKTTFIYTGSNIRPGVVVEDRNKKELVKGTDYDLQWPSASKKAGKYTVKISFKGDYEGSISMNYTVVPKTAAVKSVTPGKAKMTVKMKAKPASVGASAYKIYYRVKGTSKWKTTTSKYYDKTIKKLKKGKKYQVKGYAYCVVGGKTYKGAMSKTYTTKKIK